MTRGPTLPGARADAGGALRVLIVEENLRDDSGHYGNFIRGMAEFAQRGGARVEVWAHRAAGPGILPASVRLRRTFSRQTDEAFRGPRWSRPWHILRHNVGLLKALVLGGAVVRPPALTVAASANVYHLAAWRCWLALTPRRCRLVLVMLEQPCLFRLGARDRMTLHRSTRVQSWLFRSFNAPARAGRCVFAHEVERQGRLLRRLSGLPYVVVPIPVSPSRLAVGRGPGDARAGGPLRFGFLGSGRADKGLDCLAAAIRLGRTQWEEGPGVRFLVQCDRMPDVDEATLVMLRALAREFPERVELIEGSLSGSEYAELIRSLDGVLLPYRRSSYFARGSGIAVEAFCVGRPIVCTTGTWMAEQMGRWGAGVTFRDGEAGSLAAAVAEMMRTYAGLRVKAIGRSPLAAAAFSWERFGATVTWPGA